MKINHGYQRYRGFHIIPHELWFGYGYTHDGLQCVRVQVQYGKIPPAVYPCSTLVVVVVVAIVAMLMVVVWWWWCGGGGGGSGVVVVVAWWW